VTQLGHENAAQVQDATSAPQEPASEPIRPAYVDPAVGRWGRFVQRVERKVSKLSTKNNFWHRVCSRIYLPLAYSSGIKFAKGEESSFSAVLPFKKFNKNWYNAMAGGALLGNAEVAGGMYVFKKCGADYTVVCKHLEYTFRRPCLGPAVYRIEPKEEIESLVAAGGEFNITTEIRIMQMVTAKDEKERRVGNAIATFHVTPKSMARARQAKHLEKLQKRAQHSENK